MKIEPSPWWHRVLQLTLEVAVVVFVAAIGVLAGLGIFFLLAWLVVFG